jgi:hypothetical protein
MPITAVSTYFKASIQSTKLWLGFLKFLRWCPMSLGLSAKVGVSGWRWKEAELVLSTLWLVDDGRGEFRESGWGQPREGHGGVVTWLVMTSPLVWFGFCSSGDWTQGLVRTRVASTTEPHPQHLVFWGRSDWPWTNYVIHAGLKLSILLPHLLCARITDVYHQAQH